MSCRWLCRLLKHLLRAVSIPAPHHRPDDAGGLVGQCDRSKFGWFACQQRPDPLAITGLSIAGMAQHGNRAGSKQAADVFVAALAGPAQAFLAAARILSWRHPEPSRKLSA